MRAFQILPLPVVAACVFWGVLYSVPAHAADCLEDRRTVTFVDGQATKLRSYRCEVPSGTLDIEFHRLSDVFASLLLDGSRTVSVKPFFSELAVVETSVSSQFRRLLDVGSTLEKIGGWRGSWVVSAPGQDTNYSGAELDEMEIRVVSWSGETVDLPTPHADANLFVERKLPAGTRLYSYDLGRFDARSVYLWRDLSPSDINEYQNNLREYVDFFRLPSDTVYDYIPFPANLQDFSRAVAAWPPQLTLVRTRQFADGCGDWFSGLPAEVLERSYFSNATLPTLLVDTAVISNRSSMSITIDALLGSFDATETARPLSVGDRSEMTRLRIDPIRIEPGASVLVPIGMLLINNGEELARELSSADRAMATRYTNLYGANFSSYEEPTRKRFSFGSRFSVNGLDAIGQRFALEGRSTNYADLNIDSEGSCPYLSTWNRTQGWIEHGKILHRANAPELEEEEVYGAQGFVPRIRLDEREAERAVIRSVEAVLHLKDRSVSSTVTLPGDSRQVGEFALNWGQRIELDLVLPDGVKESDVRRTEVTLRGYYERYAAIASAIAERDPGNGVPATSMYRRINQCALSAQ